MRVKPHHPLQELLAKLLFSIETVPPKEQKRMVNRACREAVEWHKAVTDGKCPECGCWVSPVGHAEDCDLIL